MAEPMSDALLADIRERAIRELEAEEADFMRGVRPRPILPTPAYRQTLLLDEIDRLRALLTHATRFTFGAAGPYDHPHAAITAAADVDPDDDTTIHVVERPGLDRNSAGITRWAIQCAGWVRTHAGRWVDEPTPSDRTAKFLRATRWPDAASAIALAEQLVANGHPNLPEWTTGRRYPTREEDLDA